MEPRRVRRQRLGAARRAQAELDADPQPASRAWAAPAVPPRARDRRPLQPIRTRRVWRPRAYALLAGLGVLVVALGLTLLTRGRPGAPAAAPGASAPAGSTAAARTGGGQAAAAGPVWLSLPALGAGDTAGALGPDPDGSLWLAAAGPSGSWTLFHATADGADGGWTIGAAPADGSPIRIQTVGAGQVWLADGPQELAFTAASATFTPYTSQPALRAASIDGYSVGLYVPEGAAGAPYLLVALLGAAQTSRIALPGAAPPAGTPAAAVLPASGTGGLVAIGTTVWSVAPAAGSATVWGRLPAGADPASAAWGDGRLWFEAPAAAGAGTAAAIYSLTADGTTASLTVAATHPPAAGGALTFSGDQLCWSGSAAVYAYDPGSGALSSFPLPPGAAPPALLAPGTGGAVWAAVGDRFALLGGA